MRSYTINESTTVEILSTSKGSLVSELDNNLQQQKFLVLPKVSLCSFFWCIYNSRNSQYFQRSAAARTYGVSTTVEILSTSKGRTIPGKESNLQQQKFLVLPKVPNRTLGQAIYNSRNSQYFQRMLNEKEKMISTTVEILSTSKGKGPGILGTERNLQQQKFLVLPKGGNFGKMVEYLQQQKFLVLPKDCYNYITSNHLQQQKFLVLPKDRLQVVVLFDLQQQKFLVLPKGNCPG